MSLTTALLACVLLFGTAPVAHQQSDALGFIVDISGQWEIRRGAGAQPVPAERRAVLNIGDVLQKQDANPLSFVAVALYTGKLENYTKTELFTGRQATGTLARIIMAIQQRFQEGWITASVRGGSDFNDAVVKTEGGRTDLSAVLSGADAGSYSLTVHAIADGKLTAPPRLTARVIVGRVGRDAVTIAALAPGVYQVDIAHATGAAGNAWIRVVPAGRFAEAAKEFAQLPGADGGGGPELRRAARAVARTYLIVLNETPAAR